MVRERFVTSDGRTQHLLPGVFGEETLLVAQERLRYLVVSDLVVLMRRVVNRVSYRGPDVRRKQRHLELCLESPDSSSFNQTGSATDMTYPGICLPVCT